LPESARLKASDAELLSNFAAGDASAFNTFVERHRAAVYRYVGALTQDAADAEDALQDTFVAAWRSASTFQGAEAARGWLFTIARNAVRLLYRRRVGEPADFVPLDELGLDAGWGGEPGSPDLLEALESREVLERALQSLSREDREVLVLRDLEGLSNEETARLVGIAVRAAKSRLHRARLRLAARLRRELDVRA